MHWHILGAGAIGSLWAGFLSRSGQDISLILRNRSRFTQWPTAGPLEIIEAENRQQLNCQLETPDSEIPVRHLLVATKAYDTLTAVQAIQPRLAPGAEIVLLQNGMGQHQQLLEQLDNIQLWAATTTAGAWLESRHRLHCVSRGDTHIGTLTEHTPLLPSGWQKLDIPLHPCADIRPHLWRKLAINCAINPLTAIHDCRNGALLEHPSHIELMQSVCLEVEQIAAAAGIELFPDPLADRAMAVAKATGDNLSSMLQDVRQGRHTEIEQITGFLCEQARILGIEVPVNQSLLQAIRALSPKNGVN